MFPHWKNLRITSIASMVTAMLLVNLLANWLRPLPAQDVSSTQLESPNSAGASLANAFAQLVQTAIPLEYDKRKDWGQTKQIVTGLKFEDHDIKRRRKSVNHGVWKHYKVTLIDPENRLRLAIDDVRMIDSQRVGFTLTLQADLALWARAKMYERGVHLISLELVGGTSVETKITCEVGVKVSADGFLPTLIIDPHVSDAQLALFNFRIDRVSNAHGPLVKELSHGVQKAIEEELQGQKLADKLNRAIDKKRPALTLSARELVASSWWPLAKLPQVEAVVSK